MFCFVLILNFSLKNYLTSSKATMSSQLGDTTAKCRPFFDIFDANRTYLCHNVVDYINALWFFALLTLLMWSLGVPVGLNLINIQRHLNALKKTRKRQMERSDSSRSHSHDREIRQGRQRVATVSRSRARSASVGRSASRPRPL